jgi:hypothetical protein
LALALLVAASAAAAQDTESRQQSLKGLKEIKVLVEDLDAEPERDGLNKTAIQTDVELKLRQAAIRVLTRAESLETPGAPYLYINVHPMLSTTGKLYVWSITVELRQSVRLERDPNIRVFYATTWSAARVLGIVPRADLRTVREDIKDPVDEFINVYLAVNPK